MFALLAPLALSLSGAPSTPQWGLFQLNLTGPAESSSYNPFEKVVVSATFEHHGSRGVLEVTGFFDGGARYCVRFSPPAQGEWTYTTASNVPELSNVTGSLVVQGVQGKGPVRSRGFGLYTADGEPHVSVGTTSYQWASMPREMQKETLRTLRTAPFNKQRMTIFPKWYVYNHQNPVEVGTAFEIRPGSAAENASAWGCVGGQCPSLKGSFDLRRPNVSFWHNYEGLLREMNEIGVVADIILFHPYDGGHWGFDCMGGEDPATYNTTHDKFYLRYMAARLSAFSNVWWSMANEWSFNRCKGRGTNSSAAQSPSPVWDELFETLAAADPYDRQTSIHNGNLLYNHSRPWISHVSLQGHEGDTAVLRAKYGKPVIWDEVQYEGRLPCCAWGSLSAEEMEDRFWLAASLGVYAGHSETILRPGVQDDDRQPLWWAKGGSLVGGSPSRIGFYRARLAAGLLGPDFGAATPRQEQFGETPAYDGTAVANSLTAMDNRSMLVRFLRLGTWVVPLPRAAARGGSEPSRGWTVSVLDTFGAQLTPCAGLKAGEASRAGARTGGAVGETLASPCAVGSTNVTVQVTGLPMHITFSLA